jgi:hypothetical protein
MTVLSVVSNACLVLGIDQPDVLMTNTDREYQELARLVNDTARMIAEDYDWQLLQKVATITGNAVDEGFNVPSDYDRMVQPASIWSNRWSWSITKISSTDEWLAMQVTPYTYTFGNWIIYGDQFHILPVMAASEITKFFYISDLIVKDAGGVPKVAFTADTDVFRLDERLLELGVIWRSKKDKGLPFDVAKAEYDDLLMKKAKRDSGSQAVVSGNGRFSNRDARTAFPTTVGGVS